MNDAFARAVIRALQQTMPQLTNALGRVTVRILLSENGNVVSALLGGAKDTALNQDVVFAAQQTSYPIPPSGSTTADRTFMVTTSTTEIPLARHRSGELAPEPSTVDGALAYLLPVYDRWLAWRNAADLTSGRYVEVKAEDLAADWPGQRRALFERLGVEDAVTGSTFQADKLAHRDDRFDAGHPRVRRAGTGRDHPRNGIRVTAERPGRKGPAQ